ncbi:MAG: PilZ domain-containing protein [Desulfohalobiaceae bacterium]
MSSQENRSYSRVPTHIQAWARKMSPEDPGPLFRSGSWAWAQEQAPALKDTSLPESLRNFLESINSKLDTLLSLSSKQVLQGDFPLQLQVVELSGAGLKCLRPSEEILEGEQLEMVLVLTQFPVNLAGVTGRILRTEKKGAQELLALEFTKLRQSDREKIVQFVFREQREQIRTLKDDD